MSDSQAQSADAIDHAPSGGSAIGTVIAVVSAAVTLPFGESVIGVQLDAIARTFAAHGALLQWVVNAYLLAFATSILGAGILADRLGRRRLFGLGLGLTGLANAIAIIAPTIGWLIALRAVAGLGAGILLATGPALLSARFPRADVARARAFAAFGSAAGSGIAFGPLIGGLVMGWLGWRGVFAVYLPFIVLAFCLLPRIAPSRGDTDAPIDARGIGLFTLALGALIWAIEGAPGGLAGRAALIAGALGLLAVLCVVERGHRYPAIDPILFTNPMFRAMSLTMVCWQIGVAISMVYVPAVVVAGIGGSPALAGAAILPMAITLFTTTPLGPWLVSKAGVKGFIGVCVGLMAAGDGIIWLAFQAGESPSLVSLLIGLALIGVGGGAANGSLDNLAMATVSPRRAGMAAGVFQTVRIGSAALVVAMAGSVLDIAGSGTASSAAAINARYGWIAASGALVMTAIAVFCMLRRSVPSRPAQSN